MKIIDTKSYLNAICEAAQTGEIVSTVISGSSMIPFLVPNRDIVFLRLPHKKPKKGDVVLFKRENGSFVLHRIRRSCKDGYYMIGDRQTMAEGPINPEQIQLIAVSAKRKDKLITEKSLVWKFYAKIWNNLVFLRPAVFSVVRLLHKSRKTS